MVTCLTYSANYLKTIRKLAQYTSNFSLFALDTSMRSKVIALSIRKIAKINPTEDQGEDKIFSTKFTPCVPA